MKAGCDHERWSRSALERCSWLQAVRGDSKANISQLAVPCLQKWLCEGVLCHNNCSLQSQHKGLESICSPWVFCYRSLESCPFQTILCKGDPLVGGSLSSKSSRHEKEIWYS